MNIKKTKKSFFLNEKGVAVLFSLAMLSLLSLLIVGYLTSSIVDKKAASNYNALQSARITARSGVSRVLTTLSFYALEAKYELSQAYSFNEESSSIIPASGKFDTLAEKLQTTVDGIIYYDSATHTYSSSEGPHWQYLYDKDGIDTPIIGRYAYVVVSDLGKLNPAAVCDSGRYAPVNGTSSVSEANTGVSVDGKEKTSLRAISEDNTDTGKYVTGRPGRDTSEIFLRCIDDSGVDGEWFSEQDAQDICTINANPSGTLADDDGNWIRSWETFDSLFANLGISDDNDTDKNLFQKYFTLTNDPDPEAFWFDNGDLVKQNSELYNRFNITRTDWNDTEEVNVTGFLDAEADKYEGGVDSDLYLPWLKNWKGSGGYGSVTACRKQIIANLIDYSDLDIIATTDYPDTPTFVGLDKSPYINEVRIKFTCNSKFQDNTDPATDSASAEVIPDSLKVEVVNLYEEDNFDLNAKVTMNWEYKIAQKTISREGHFNNIKINIDTLTSGKRYWSNTDDADSKFSDGNWLTTGGEYNNDNSWFETDSPQSESGVKDLKITSLNIKLTDDTGIDFYDYSYIIDSDRVVASPYSTGDTVLISGGSDTSNQSFVLSKTATGTNSSEGPAEYYFNAQVDDPRQNLLISDWQLDSDSTDPSTIESKNSICSPNPGGNSDSESGASEPWEISTAYIRNAPVNSLWEIGFIHRGKKWQTINLKKYNADEAMDIDGGGGEYKDGDANILDQMKMTNYTTVLQKININTTLTDVLKILFQKIRLGSNDTTQLNYQNNYDVPGRLTSYEVDVTNAQKLADQILLISKSNTNAPNFFNNRAEILNWANSSITDLLVYDNSITGTSLPSRNRDALQEELVGKFINLIKAEHPANIYTVIVVAQRIKDKGGVTLSSADGNKDGNPTSNISTVIGRYDVDGDEILASQKIMAIVKRKSEYPDTNKLFILRLQYLND